jgi:hypothetical protein
LHSAHEQKVSPPYSVKIKKIHTPQFVANIFTGTTKPSFRKLISQKRQQMIVHCLWLFWTTARQFLERVMRPDLEGGADDCRFGRGGGDFQRPRFRGNSVSLA